VSLCCCCEVPLVYKKNGARSVVSSYAPLMFLYILRYRAFDRAAGLSCIEFPQLDDIVSRAATAGGLCYFQVHLLYRPGHYDILYTS
jgi:hypothetical protein